MIKMTRAEELALIEQAVRAGKIRRVNPEEVAAHNEMQNTARFVEQSDRMRRANAGKNHRTRRKNQISIE